MKIKHRIIGEDYLNRSGHKSMFDCKLIDVVTKEGLTNLIEVVTKAGLTNLKEVVTKAGLTVT
jgi:Cys-tRNA synthase (O-phospho-L-seryl-tRNA:Cys-tRNA synthase)